MNDLEGQLTDGCHSFHPNKDSSKWFTSARGRLTVILKTQIMGKVM